LVTDFPLKVQSLDAAGVCDSMSYREPIMSIASFTNLEAWGLPPEPVRRISVNEYHQMIQAEVFTADDSCELIEGWLFSKMPHNPPHDYVMGQFDEYFTHAVFGSTWKVRFQSALTLMDGEPEPDVAICVGPNRRYATRKPTASDTRLVIEVSDSTLARDRGIKLRSYARAGIAEYWIVNLIDRQIEIYTEPQPTADPPTYAAPRITLPGGEVSVMLDGKTWLTIPASELLP
jgi:Uma2 family endonuclease